MNHQIIIILLLFSFSGSINAAKIYKWKDAKGQIHYSSTPPVKVETKSTGISTTKNITVHDKSTLKNTNKINNKLNQENLKKQQSTADRLNELSKKLDSEFKENSENNKELDAFTKNYKYNNYDPSGKWKQKVITNCKNNRGVDCENPSYLESHRPLTENQREILNYKLCIKRGLTPDTCSRLRSRN